MNQPKIERMLRLMKMLASNKNYTVDVEAKLLQKYLDEYRRLPIWNKAF